MTDTKTPYSDAGDGRIFGADGKLIAQAMGLHSADECLAHIAFIVRACNAHEALVGAVKSAIDELGETHIGSLPSCSSCSTVDELKAALALA